MVGNPVRLNGQVSAHTVVFELEISPSDLPKERATTNHAVHHLLGRRG